MTEARNRPPNAAAEANRQTLVLLHQMHSPSMFRLVRLTRPSSTHLGRIVDQTKVVMPATARNVGWPAFSTRVEMLQFIVPPALWLPSEPQEVAPAAAAAERSVSGGSNNQVQKLKATNFNTSSALHRSSRPKLQM